MRRKNVGWVQPIKIKSEMDLLMGCTHPDYKNRQNPQHRSRLDREPIVFKSLKKTLDSAEQA